MPSSFAFENKFQEYYIFNERGIHPTATSNAGGLRIADRRYCILSIRISRSDSQSSIILFT